MTVPGVGRVLLSCWLIGTAVISAPLSAQNQSVAVTGTLVDSASGQPIAHATVYLVDGAKTETDNDGRFVLRKLSAQPTIILFRRIGFAPWARRLSLANHAGSSMSLGTIRLAQLATQLDSISIQASLLESNPRMNDFFRRRRNGRGHYVTRQDVLKKNPYMTEELFPYVGGRSRIGCHTLILDGMVMSRPRRGDPVSLDPFDVNLIPPSWIGGIEIYQGSINTPLEIEGGVQNPCGVILIWTVPDDR